MYQSLGIFLFICCVLVFAPLAVQACDMPHQNAPHEYVAENISSGSGCDIFCLCAMTHCSSCVNSVLPASYPLYRHLWGETVYSHAMPLLHLTKMVWRIERPPRA